MGGTSRNIDRLIRQVTDVNDLRRQYRALLDMGIDLIETDLPREVGPLLYGRHPVPASRAPFLQSGPR